MKKVWGYILFYMMFALLGCGEENGGVHKTTTYQELKGGRFEGGTFRLNENEYFHDLFPHAIIDATGSRIGYQIYEGLVKFNPHDLSIEPGIAKNWEKDSSGTLYTFHLRENVYFHRAPFFDNKEERKVTAQDFKFCFELLCSDHSHDAGYEQTFKGVVKGAEKYHKASRDTPPSYGVSGIKVLDDYTLQIKLKKPFAPFIYLLASPFTAVFPPQAYKARGFDMRIGTGPFRLDTLIANKKVVLLQNQDYYKYDKFGNQLPYLDTIEVSFLPSKEKEVMAFKKGQLDMIYQLPTEAIIEVLETKKNAPQHKRYIQQRTPEMSVEYYGFLTSKKIFSNKKIRKAFNYAIDREYICDKVLGGEVYAPAQHGITPPTIKGYDISTIKGYHFDTTKARELLAKAGYEQGKNFPIITLDVNAGGGRNLKVAKAVKKQLKDHLNVTVKINKLSLNEKIRKTKHGQSQFWRTGWIADYPHPQNFLMLLYGGNVPATTDTTSFPNTTRYSSNVFDKLYKKGLRATTTEKSYKYFRRAEQKAIKEAPVIPLWYEESYRILQPYVRHFPNNAMQYRDFTKVWFDFKWEQKEKGASGKQGSKTAFLYY